MTSKSTKSVPPPSEDTEAYVSIPPDGGWGWLVVIAAFYIFFVSDGVLISLGVFLQEIARSLKCTPSEVSIAGAIQTCCYCFAGPFSAALVNRFGFRWVVSIGCVVSSASCFCTGLSARWYQMILAYGVLGGIGFGMMYVSAIIVLGFYFERWRALASGIALCGAGIGSTCMPPILSMVIKTMGWRYAFHILGTMCCTCIFCGIVFKPIKPVKVRIELIGMPKRTLSNITEVQETKSKMSQFFLQYNNATYPTVAEVKTSVIALLRPSNKITATRSTSSEIMATTLASDVSEHAYHKRAEKRFKGTFRKCSICCYRCCESCRRRRKKSTKPTDMPSRPMYRDDIFYIGSIATLPEYQKSAMLRPPEVRSKKSVVEYHISVTRTATHYDMEEQALCKLCPEAIKRTLATMLDFRLMKSVSFNLMLINSFSVAFSFYTPFVYIKNRAIENKMDAAIALWLISAIGVANTIGRIICGILSSFPNIKANIVCGSLLFLGGVATVTSGLSYVPWFQFMYAVLYGLSMSSISTLRSVIIVDILGLEKLTNAIGMILLFQGVASFMGTYISAMLRDQTGDYTASFYVSGSVLAIGAFFLMPLRKLKVDDQKSVLR
ncbi:monocarboxylate transporter [Holotrichia oblita]|uniref:Monocarboxylate transporter n=1 Tax=Holotrichia oblita TaxID=644536 RepID=A0ACB9TB92_HOLOL|nr:monocarboxylate transporter [Holotrichia oblita]